MLTYKFSTKYFLEKQAERHSWLQGTLFGVTKWSLETVPNLRTSSQTQTAPSSPWDSWPRTLLSRHFRLIGRQAF